MIDRTKFICLLPEYAQKVILADLQAHHSSEEDVQNGMDSRLCDVEQSLGIIYTFKELMEG